MVPRERVANASIPVSATNSLTPGRQPIRVKDATISEHLSERKVDASSAGQRMLPVLKRRDTVIDKASGTAPHRDVTAFEAQTAHGIGAAFTAPQEYGRQAKRDGDDRSPV